MTWFNVLLAKSISAVRVAMTSDLLQKIITHHLPNLEGPFSYQPIPTGKFNDSFFVQAGAKELVLRIAPPRDSVFVFYERDMMRQEPGIHELLLKETKVPVAPILCFDDSLEILDRDFLLMERLPGSPLTQASHLSYSRVLQQVGAYLSETHLQTRTQYGYLGEHHPMEPQEKWVDAFQIMWHKMIADIVSVGHYDNEESSLFLRLLDKHLSLFDREFPASLLHMDIWHQNILVNEEGQVTGIVDWDRALWGDPEIEFAVLDYCGISEPPFWEGYNEKRDLSPDARVRQIFYLLYELQKYIVIRQGRQRDNAGAKRYKNQVMSVLRQSFL